MKTGRTLQEMAVELERQQKVKRDFIAPTSQLSMVDSQQMAVSGHGSFGITDNAHDQLAARLNIPRKYYDRINVEAPGLLTANVNHWLQAQPEQRMVRTLDGQMRAFLSSRYRPLDNFDLAEAVLPILTESALSVQVESAQLTERALYIKAITPTIAFHIRPDDEVFAGIVISNSEVGAGSVKIEPMIYRLVCKNGMIANLFSLQKYHVGRNFEVDLAEQFYRDETRNADDRAFWMKVQDTVRGSFNRDVFLKIAASLQASATSEINGDPVEVVECVQRQFGLADSERSSILTHLIKGGDLTQYGLVNAITRASQDVSDYDRATSLERLGGDVLELPGKQWDTIRHATR